MNALRLGLGVASLLFLFAPLRSDDSVYAPGKGDFAIEHKLNALIVSIDFNNATIEQAINALQVEGKQADYNHQTIQYEIEPETVSTAPHITLKLDNVPLGVALHYVCELARLRYHVDKNAVFLSALNTVNGDHDLIKRTFHVDPSFVENMQHAIPPSALLPP